MKTKLQEMQELRTELGEIDPAATWVVTACIDILIGADETSRQISKDYFKQTVEARGRLIMEGQDNV